MRLDAVIFGGGVAGLWLMDELRRRGAAAVLIERDACGTGQTIGAQGIIHGGLKYTLAGLLTGSAERIREMPGLWRDCLAGRREPDLSGVAKRADFCYLWRTDAIRGRFGMIGAKAGLRVAPTRLDESERPEALRGAPGEVLRLDEQVLSCRSLIQTLVQRNQDHLIRDPDPAIVAEGSGVRITTHGREVVADHAVFTAGAGNATLRSAVGLDADRMQRRPLHMVMIRSGAPAGEPGSLPVFNGHCVDGKKTRVTVTTECDATGHPVWTVGGQVSEDGVGRSESEQYAVVRRELAAVMPSVDLSRATFGSWRVDRAEPRTAGGLRPDDAFAEAELGGRVITAWPTKLALAPRLAERVIEEMGSDAETEAEAADRTAIARDAAAGLPRPETAANFWDAPTDWHPAPLPEPAA